MSARRTLTRRALNRALLARQGLLERIAAPAEAMIERLVALQAQEPFDPYVALAARIERFRPEELSELIETRAAVRAQLLRATIHLATARDALALHPLTLPVLARTFKSSWARRAGGADVAAVVGAGRELLAERPLTRGARRGAGPALAGRGGRRARAGRHVPHGAGAGPAAGALGPQRRGALGADRGLARRGARRRRGDRRRRAALPRRVRAGVGGRRAHVVGLHRLAHGARAAAAAARDVLRRGGARAVDVPDAPLPDSATPAPPRFLPEYDNVLLAHADRSRMLAGLGPGLPWPAGRWVGTLLVDGCFRAYWNVAGATLTVDRFTPHPDDPPGTVEAIASEGGRLLELVAPAGERRVEFDPPP